jgi:LacI family transcriptional regulator
MASIIKIVKEIFTFYVLQRTKSNFAVATIIESALEMCQSSIMNLKELSKHLGLSPTTVSRALNGYPEVGAETKRRVDAEAQRLGYQPNPHARRLATGRSHAIGHVFPTDRSLMIDPLFSDFVAGAAEIYAAHGFEVMLHAGGSEDEISVYRRYAQGGAVDGVVVLGPRVNDLRIAVLNKLKLPFIVHGRLDEHEDSYAWLDIDNRGAFQKATKLLTDLGHRRIGIINGLEDMTFALHRKQGYESALRDKGIGIDPMITSSGLMTEENGYRQTKRILQMANRPTALLLSSMLLVSGAMRAINEMGMQIGKDISVIAHDDGLPFLNADGLVPSLTTTRSSIRAAGSRVAELLLNIITDSDAEQPHELWSVDLIVRGSTGAVGV